MIYTLKFLSFFLGLPLAAFAAASVIGAWIIPVVFVAMLVYLAGAAASAWTFLGEPASIRQL